MEIKAQAKLNWTLDITGKRADGYHLLDMLMQPISLYDTLTIEESDTLTLDITGNDALKAEPDNLVLRAARALQQAAGTQKGAHITLEKHIPTGAGLGGGSADAAAALKGLNELWGLGLPLKSLQDIGLSLGADIPFCLADAPMRVRGIGERLSPLPVGRTFELVLVKPCEGLSTREVYQRSDTLSPIHPKTEAAMDALALGDLPLLRASAANALLPAALALRPALSEAFDALCAADAPFTAMTGSGAVIFGAFKTAAEADAAYERLKKYAYPYLERAHTIR